ncbi:MAG: acyl-CoA dehydrogenase [Acidobacteriia bacterium]|jgi:butyryl-CoA dehydrogenase/short/branched chain acyl-CoA dehydrogenase|nr:acyl-CoA dehydrogenase [Terriglobia bacterium]
MLINPLTQLTEEEEMFRDAIRIFSEDKIKPLTQKMDEEETFDSDLLKQFFKINLMGIQIPEQWGGAGGSFFMSILAVEELSRVDPSAGVIVDVQNTLVNNALLNWGTKKQKSQYLPQLSSHKVGAYALSESGAGSDAFALKTIATADGNSFLLNGQKLWTTNALEADIFVVFATVDPNLGHRGITAFLVEKSFPGFSLGKKEIKLGIRASSTCEVILNDCRVPNENVLGEIGNGYKVSIETLNEGRIGIAGQMIGLADGALHFAIQYSRERKQFDQSLSNFQAIRFQLAELSTQLEAARLLTYNAARMKDVGKPFIREAAMAKYFASQVAEKITSQAIEILGGYGYTRDYPVEKYFRDSKIGKIYEGTSFMQLETISKFILSKKD